jgi:subtilisin family serine protease
MSNLRIAVVIALLGAIPAAAGYLAFDPSDLSQYEYIPVIIFMEEQADVAGLTAQLDQREATLWERHQVIVGALKETASRTQGELLSLLRQAEQEGKVEKITPFWLANMVGASVKEESLHDLTCRGDVYAVYYDSELELIQPVSFPTPGYGRLSKSQWNLEMIKADSAWAMGYTGDGVLVANLDTGVEADHPSLHDSWRGFDPRYSGHPEWAWRDSLTQTNYPFDPGYHGTHTMGTQCGVDHSTGDTVGVAIGAQWIAASDVDRGGNLDERSGRYIKCFEWFIEPAREQTEPWHIPATVSNSWGHSLYNFPNDPCDERYWEVLDNMAAAGIIVLFSAGNEGSSGLRVPGNRKTTDYNAFAVGAVDESKNAASFSARGPSPCVEFGPDAITPEVTAPGVDVRSAYAYGGYTTLSGTSMSCPHVAGAAAILRQVNPNATVEQVLGALMQTAEDLGSTGNDNTFGWGLIDLPAAIRLVQKFDYVTFDAEPVNRVVPRGGTLSYVVDGDNNTGSAKTIDFWATVYIGPRGGQYGPVLGPVEVTLGPYQHVHYTVSQRIPMFIPTTRYNYNLYVGEYPHGIWHQESFRFRVTSGVESGSHTGQEDWVLLQGFEERSSLDRSGVGLPDGFFLGQNSPNPFNENTKIVYTIDEGCEVELKVYNLRGQEVATLAAGYQEPGYYTVTWDASEVASGVYFYKLQAGRFSEIKRMNLLK